MPRTLASVLVLAALVAAPVLAQDAPAPKAVFESTTFDGGPVAPGAEVQAKFVVRNDGAGDLRILSVKPG
jgi:ribulose 1,5-bisphosphate synthetase/thiazole synthase